MMASMSSSIKEPVFLNTGRVALVFSYRNDVDRKNYAVKLVIFDERDEEQVKKEALILARLEHKNIVKYAWSEISLCSLFPICSTWADLTQSCREDVEPAFTDQALQPFAFQADGDLEMVSEDHPVQIGYYHEDNPEPKDQSDLKKHLYIRMELCGRNLRQVLDDQAERIDFSESLEHWNWVIECLRQIAKGLSYMHRKGFIHCNICPENILLGNDGKIKIAGFGLAQRVPIFPNEARLDRRPLCYHYHADVRTPYMSPEQLRGEDFNHKADVHSLGQLFFMMQDPSRSQDDLLRFKAGFFPPNFGTPAMKQLLVDMTKEDIGTRIEAGRVVARCRRILIELRN